MHLRRIGRVVDVNVVDGGVAMPMVVMVMSALLVLVLVHSS
jgi:hypothetical protein